MMPRAKVARDLPTPMRRRQFLRARILAASSCAAHLLPCQVFAAVGRVVRIRQIRAAHPLPTVASHVQDSVGARALGKTADVAKIIPARVEMSASSVRQLIAPGILARVGAARGFLPFRFGRQALSEPSAIRQRTEPRRFHDRSILMTGVGAPLTVAAMHASIVILYIVIFFPARPLRSNAADALV